MEFRDLKRQYQQLKTEIDAGIAEVIASASFISGPQVKELEKQLAEYAGVKHCITCANGTDAISIALMAHGVGAGDAVFVPDFTFFSSGECPATVGATPVFVDVRKETYNIDCDSLVKAIEKVTEEGKLKPRAVVAVDLFGLPAEYDRLNEICKKYDLLLLEDGAQGFGGSFNGKRVGGLAPVATTSFFPAKPLGCYGDGGAIFTDDDEIATMCRSIAVHGKDMEHPDDPMSKYNNLRLGLNSRLDTVQAAVLIAKFKAFREFELEDVNRVAGWYTERLADIEGLVIPEIREPFYSSWAQYTIQLPEGADRAKMQAELKTHGIPTMVYYQKPMHLQGAFEGTRSAEAECPVTEYLCKNVLCLPIHPYLKEDEAETVTKRLKELL